MKVFSVMGLIGEMPVKTTMRYHFALLQMAKRKKSKVLEGGEIRPSHPFNFIK